MPLFHTKITGIVQGVGFRPFVANLARAHRICGTVANKGPYVEIYAQGPASACQSFHRALQQNPPARAIILTLHTEELPETTLHFHDFQIIESESEQGPIYVSPDIATCDDCARELYDPKNPRYLHPFINCTNCGPRLTIQESAPYDRCRTTMKTFPMCPRCAAEYHDPQNRRYDAQPVCCPNCGPHIYLLKTNSPSSAAEEDVLPQEDASPLRDHDRTDAAAGRACKDSVKESSVESGGPSLPPPSHETFFASSEPLSSAITNARRALIDGKILALKGIGGFHLACDATNEAAVARLRARKHRPFKPFALMAESIETIEQIALIEEDAQRALLTGHQKPILLLKKKSPLPTSDEASPLRNRGTDAAPSLRDHEPVFAAAGRARKDSVKESSVESGGPSLPPPSHEPLFACPESSSAPLRVAPSVAPYATKLGLLLPYTPLHMLLFHYPDGLDDQMPKLLVMTSGNPSGAPICHTDQEAQESLSGIADLILTHNRPIRLRADDTVLDWHNGRPYPIRRSRGFAPLPIYFTPLEPPYSPQADRAQSDRFRRPPQEPAWAFGPAPRATGHPSGGRGLCDSERSGEHPSGAEKTDKAALKNITPESPSSPRNIAREDSPRSESAQSPRPTATTTDLRDHNRTDAASESPAPTFASSDPQSLAIGAELKNTFTLARGPLLYPSPYIGDTTDLRTVLALEDSANLLSRLLGIRPQLIACDLHPRYNTTALAEKLAKELRIPLLKIQHHHAHILSCLAEHGETGPALGLALDGTGYGPDSTVWGGELLLATPASYTRLATIDPFLQAGGDKAPREPWRIALALLQKAFPSGEGARRAERVSEVRPNAPHDTDLRSIAVDLLHLCTAQEYAAQTFLLGRHLNTITSTSCGRLFDAVSALLGLCTHATCEGEAPMRLEALAETWADQHPAEAAAILQKAFPSGEDARKAERVSEVRPDTTHESNLRSVHTPFRIPTTALFAQIARQRIAALSASPSKGSALDFPTPPASPFGGGGPEGAGEGSALSTTTTPAATTGELAYTFHAHLARLLADACDRARTQTGLNTIALSGGVFQNTLLLSLTEQHLTARHFRILTHHQVPPNDGGLSLGQSLAAQWHLTHPKQK